MFNGDTLHIPASILIVTSLPLEMTFSLLFIYLDLTFTSWAQEKPPFPMKLSPSAGSHKEASLLVYVVILARSICCLLLYYIAPPPNVREGLIHEAGAYFHTLGQRRFCYNLYTWCSLLCLKFQLFYVTKQTQLVVIFYFELPLRDVCVNLNSVCNVISINSRHLRNKT